ncbi:MAG: hypothetical protein H0V49_12670 [Nocardioidaceae bacterium]|nr:hypothetical protein [Nocardioidaceae bacterium]
MKWGLLATLAALPLQWYIIVTNPLLGAARLHQLAILAFAGIFFIRYKPHVIVPLRRQLGPFVLANVCMLTVWSAIQLYYGKLPVGPFQEFLYLGVFLAVGAFIYRARTDQEGKAVELLRWTAATASVAVLVALSYSMLRNGVNPARVFAQTISAGDPEIFQKQLFKTAFVGFGYDEETVRGNIRHEVFGAVLCAMYISAWAARSRPLRSPALRVAYQFSMLMATVLLISSLSRSIIIAAAVWPMLSLFRSVRTFTLSARQVVLAYVSLAFVALAAASGAGLVLWNRFTTDTSSYEARQGLYEQAFDSLGSYFLLGGVETEKASSHNFVLDALLRGGIFVALPAAVVVLSVVWTWLKLVSRLHLEPDWMLPVAAAFVLPIVRFVTSGGGLINPVEWVTLGFIAGALAAHRYRPVAGVGAGASYRSQPALI